MRNIRYRGGVNTAGVLWLRATGLVPEGIMEVVGSQTLGWEGKAEEGQRTRDAGKREQR